jgi:hypothetical protein
VSARLLTVDGSRRFVSEWRCVIWVGVIDSRIARLDGRRWCDSKERTHKLLFSLDRSLTTSVSERQQTGSRRIVISILILGGRRSRGELLILSTICSP